VHAREYNHIIAPRLPVNSALASDASANGVQGGLPIIVAVQGDGDVNPVRRLELNMAEIEGNATVADPPTNSFLTDTP